MGFGVSFKLAPGVRVRASTRGVRASVGPRAARVHVGAGRTRVSTGAGPITVSAPLGAGRRRAPNPSASRSTPGSSRPRQPTVAQLQAQTRAAERAREVASVAAVDTALTTLHHLSFPDSTRQVVPVPPVPGVALVDAVRSELYRAAITGVPVWRRAARKGARVWAQHQALAQTQRRHTGQVVIAQLEQLHLDEQWRALNQHDPVVVIEAVDGAFADNASDSTCVDAGTDPLTGARYVTAVVTYWGIDLVPEHRPDVTPGGRPTLRRRTKTERNAIYASAIASTALATAKEALAVAVTATEARVLVVRAGGLGTFESVYAGTFRRDFLTQRDWRHLDPLEMAMSAGDAAMNRKGQTKEVMPLPVNDDSPLRGLLNAWSDCEGHDEAGR